MKTAELLVLAALASTPDVEDNIVQMPKIEKQIPAPNQPLCGELTQIKGYLLNKFGEIPFLEMSTTRYNVNLIMFANPETSSWSIFAFDKAQNGACLIDVGVGLKPSTENSK